MNMKGKSIAVAGGASGLGLATSESLGRAGAKVAIIDLNRQSLDACCSALKARGYDVHGFAGDIVPKGEAAELFGQAVARLGRIDGLVNCAGVYPRRPIL